MKHQTPSEFYTSPVNVELIGAGATGSQILAGLVRLHLAMLELGHPHGMRVRCWDHDTVSHANIGRQLFVNSEIGTNKAVTLVSRYNYHFGLEWHAKPERFLPTQWFNGGNLIVISAVLKSGMPCQNTLMPTLSTVGAVWTLDRYIAATACRNCRIRG